MIKGLIVTHGKLGEVLIEVAESILERKSGIESFNMGWNEDGSLIVKKIESYLNRNKENSVIIFTDMFGGSPTNLSLRFNSPQVEILTGINLPGILKFLTYKEKNIEFFELIKLVKNGSKEGINIISEYLGERKYVKRENQNSK
ncbi:MAG: hypothetical protein ABFR75_08305 [Acidobacteriota bacterium]